MMKNYAQELFLLITTLSQLRNRDRVIKLFIQGLHEVFQEVSFAWISGKSIECNSIVEVCTRNKNFGFIAITTKDQIDAVIFDLIRNTAQLLALLLEKLEQEKLLLNQKDQLQILVEERTNELNKVNLQLEEELSERKQAEKKLHESEALLNTTQRLTRVGGWQFNVGTGKSIWTEELYRIHELPTDSDIDHLQESLKCYRPEDRPVIHDAFQRAIEKGETYDLEFPFTTYKGHPLWIRTTAQPVYEKGQVVRVFGNVMDITGRKLMEKTLKESEKKYRAFFHTNPDATYIYTLDDGKIIAINEGYTRMFGYTEAEVISKASFEFDMWVNPAERTLLVNKYGREGKIENYEALFYNKAGDIVHTLLSTSAINLGGVQHAFSIAKDITKRKRAEEALRISEERYRTAQVMGHVGNWEFNLQTNEFWGSDEAKRIYGFDLEHHNFTTDEIENCIPERERVHQALVDLIETDKPYNLEFDIHPKDSPKPRIISSVAELKRDEHGKPLLVMGVIQDITERKQVEESLHRLNRELRATSNCNQVLVRAGDEQTLLNDICRIINDEAGYRLVWVGYADHDDAKTIRPVAWAGHDNGYISNAKLSWSDKTERGRGPAGEAIRSGEVVYIQDFSTDPHLAPWRESALQGGYHSAIALPLKDERADVFGVLLLYSTETNAFIPDELRLLEELAGDLAYGIVVLRTRYQRKLAEEELLSASLYARSLIEASIDPLVTISPDGKITDVNQATELVTGILREHLINSDFSDYFTEPEKARLGYQKVMAQGSVRDYPLTIQHISGKTTDVLYNATIFMNEAGEIQGVFAAAHNIEERKKAEEEISKLNRELEKRVVERTLKLEAVNKELEAFAYSVSHDLRAPLRAIDGFSQAFLEEYEDQVDEQGKSYLQHVRSAAQRMAQLIDDMLSLSRVSRMEMTVQQVNMSKMFREIAANLKETQPDRNVKFIIQEGIEAQGDGQLLRIVLENLLGNAWKFTSKHPTALIEFGMMQQKKMPAYFIRDDGAGFDMKYVEKLFGAFQRLHTVTEFPGTGIGLATVQRVIHRHGGRVWAEGEVGKGAAVYFTIP